jgi:hypothetical protein
MVADRSTLVGVPHPQGLGEDPFLYFTRVYLSFLQGLFKQFPTGSYRWSPSPDDSEIMITDQAPIPRDRIDQRPAIVTMRGQAQFASMTLNQMQTVDARTGMRRHTDLVPCTMTLNCIAREGLEAQRIAWIVMRHIRTFRPTLQRMGGMHEVGDKMSMAPETPVGSLVSPEPSPEMVNVAVFSPFFFKWTEEVTPTDSPLVQGIEAHMTANLHPLPHEHRSEVAARRPTIRGVPIHGESVSITLPIEQTVKS